MKRRNNNNKRACLKSKMKTRNLSCRTPSTTGHGVSPELSHSTWEVCLFIASRCQLHIASWCVQDIMSTSTARGWGCVCFEHVQFFMCFHSLLCVLCLISCCVWKIIFPWRQFFIYSAWSLQLLELVLLYVWHFKRKIKCKDNKNVIEQENTLANLLIL